MPHRIYSVYFTPESIDQLEALYTYIADAASPRVADQFTNAIVDYCEGMCTFPERGTCRNDIRPGLRITNYKGRTVVAFDVSVDQVTIIGIFYGGQDYETTLNSPGPDSGM